MRQNEFPKYECALERGFYANAEKLRRTHGGGVAGVAFDAADGGFGGDSEVGDRSRVR